MVLDVRPREPATEERVTAVEVQIGVRLPSPYRDWRLRSNGGKLPPYTSVPGTVGPGILSKLDPVEVLPSIGSLAQMDLVPAGYLIVSLGAGGSLALKVREDDYGSVWWADSTRQRQRASSKTRAKT